MSGSGYVPVQQASVVGPNSMFGGAWFRDVPSSNDLVKGVATCANVFADSPPTLLQAFEVVSYDIGYGVELGLAAGWGTSPPTVTAELALLINGRVAHVNDQTQDAVVVSGQATDAVVTGVWSADLVNPIVLRARDRLSVRVGYMSSLEANDGTSIVVGAQLGVVTPIVADGFESSITYNVFDLPASRRL